MHMSDPCSLGDPVQDPGDVVPVHWFVSPQDQPVDVIVTAGLMLIEEFD
jgi:hypothetical protein